MGTWWLASMLLLILVVALTLPIITMLLLVTAQLAGWLAIAVLIMAALVTMVPVLHTKSADKVLCAFCGAW